MKTWHKWLLGVFGALIVTIAAVVVLFDWNWLRSPLTAGASKQTGRDIQVGDVQGQWSLTPTISLRDVHIGNTDWGTAKEFFSAELIEVTIDLPQLLRGRTVLPYVKLVKPSLAMEMRPDGTSNWDLTTRAAAEMVTPDERSEVPLIGRLDIQDGQLRYKDAKRGLDVLGKLSTATADGGEGETRMQFNGQGTLQGEKFQIVFVGGSLLSLREDDKPYPVSIEVTAVGTQATITGTLDDPITFDGLDLKTRLRGPNLSRLTTITGVPFPITPPYDLRARLQRDGKVFTFTDLIGEMGHSDLKGAVSFDARKERLFIEADLVSRKLDYRDVGFLIGIPPPEVRAAEDAKKKAEKPAQAATSDKVPHKQVLPDAPLSVKQVRAVDARVKFRGDKVDAPNVPLSGVQLDLVMKDGVLHMKPLQVGVAGGTAIADIRIDARREPVVTDYDLKLKAFELGDFLKSAGFENAGKGRIDGRIRLSGAGETVHKSLGHSDGDIRLVMNGGEMSNLAIEIVGLDVAEAVGLWATKDKNVQIRCMVADLGVRKGIVDPRLFLLDTTDSTLLIDGGADLNSELMDIRVKVQPKDISVLSMRTPIRITGSFAEPSVGIDKAALAARGAAAVALGVLLTPVASILAFIEPGLAEDSDCAALLATVQSPANVKTHDKIEAPPTAPQNSNK